MNKNMDREQVINDLLQMQEKTVQCKGFIAGMVTQAWAIEMLGDKIREYGGNPYVLKNDKVGTLQMIREKPLPQDPEKRTVDVQTKENIDYDALACVIIDEFERDREDSGRKEIVSGMERVLGKYTNAHDREIIDEMLMIFTGYGLRSLIENSTDYDYDQYL